MLTGINSPVVLTNPSDLKECQLLLQEVSYSFSIRHNLLWPYHEPLKISRHASKKIRLHEDLILFTVDGVLLFKIGINDSYYIDPDHGFFFTITNDSLLQKIEYALLPIDDLPHVFLKDFACHRVPMEYLKKPSCLKEFYISVKPRPGINHPLTYERAINNRDIYFEKKESRFGESLKIEFWAK